MAKKTTQTSTFTCKCGAVNEVEVELYGFGMTDRDKLEALCAHCDELLSSFQCYDVRVHLSLAPATS
ncbi:UNVERIFIED_ORG: hypothetical protein LHK14_01190 [Roseateles sp. XES5]|uniref:hypothetical protein n=1 Tax=Shinella sp. G-2 TaxID=3133141 RepID=UPI001D03332F|nr:hypothetical protein [Roseateles sp. XES5]